MLKLKKRAISHENPDFQWLLKTGRLVIMGSELGVATSDRAWRAALTLWFAARWPFRGTILHSPQCLCLASALTCDFDAEQPLERFETMWTFPHEVQHSWWLSREQRAPQTGANWVHMFLASDLKHLSQRIAGIYPSSPEGRVVILNKRAVYFWLSYSLRGWFLVGVGIAQPSGTWDPPHEASAWGTGHSASECTFPWAGKRKNKRKACLFLPRKPRWSCLHHFCLHLIGQNWSHGDI